MTGPPFIDLQRTLRVLRNETPDPSLQLPDSSLCAIRQLHDALSFLRSSTSVTPAADEPARLQWLRHFDVVSPVVSLMHASLSIRLPFRIPTRTVFVAFVAVLAVMGARSVIAGVIHGTGTAGPNTRDSNWSVVGLPTNWGAAPATPYQAYAFQRGGINWYGGEAFGSAQTGYTNAQGTVYWIGVQSTPESIIPFGSGTYHWIVAQTFTVDQAGMYTLTFPAFSDELLSVYVNGTVTPGELLPTITGGTLVSSGTSNGVNFQTLTTVSGSSYLNAGTNTIYAQIQDSGFSTGVMLGEVTIAAVPEPSTLVLGALGTVGLVVLARRSLSESGSFIAPLAARARNGVIRHESRFMHRERGIAH